MELLKTLKKIGNPPTRAGLLALLMLGWASLSFAADPQFSAEVDRPQISIDESVSLKLKLTSDGNLQPSPPVFSAPDFEDVNEYTSNVVQSYYENGSFGMRVTREFTHVLKPTKEGSLHISGISIQVDGKTYHAENISIEVGGAGARTPPPRSYGGGGIGLRGSSKQLPRNSVFVRAEIDKDKAYKGEQVIVSYYLYRKVQVFNFQVDQWPVLNGFLREDLEMPIMNNRLDSERVIMDGQPYQRSLISRYAAYPLQAGTLKIDSLTAKYNYYAAPSGFGNGDDPFMSFFQQSMPRSGQYKSDELSITVLPLPEEGRPQSFTGGVGDFTVVSAVDKYEVRANEAVTLTVKVEGHGNVPRFKNLTQNGLKTSNSMTPKEPLKQKAAWARKFLKSF